MKTRYPKTFERQAFEDQLVPVVPQPSKEDHDAQGDEVYMPTLEEIAERAAEIRKGWTAKHCNNDTPPPYERPTVSTDALSATAWPTVEPLYLMDE